MTPKPRPLAAAARRLRLSPPEGFPRQAGRPRQRPLDAPGGHTSGHTPAPATPEVAGSSTKPAPRARPVAGRALPPRLLGVRDAALFLGVNVDAVRDLIAGGHLPRVRLPGGAGGDLRRVLVDVRDLDRLVENAKEPAP